MPREANRRPGPCLPVLLGGLVASLTLLLPARSAAESSVYYSQQRSFQIPFHLDPAETRVHAVFLHVSTDGGKNYEEAGSASPEDKNFRFHARGDGWYWFVVQTKDSTGELNPKRAQTVQPGLRVCVDRTSPVVRLNPVQPREGTVAVDWVIQDDNLELLTLTLEYRPEGGKEWLPLNVRQLPEGQYSWTPGLAGPFEVQLRVSDKAGNVGLGTTRVTATTEARGAPGQAVSAGPGKGDVIYVRNREFNLNYTIDNVGPSAVKKVEVWATRDDRRSWTRYPAEGPPTGPCKIKVAEEGKYGFTLIPISGVGLAERSPHPGDNPQIWVQVDEKPPRVALVGMPVVGTGADHGKITVRWNATDPFLQQQPITISRAERPDGPWTPLAAKLDNTGVYVHTGGTEPPLPFEFFLKVEAVDKAGNVGSAQTVEKVKVDLKIPKISSVNVDVSEAQPARPPG